MGDGGRYCYSARDIRQALREVHPEEASRALVAGFQAFVERDRSARARLAGNHPIRHKLLDRADDLPFTVHQDLMHLDPQSVFTPAAWDALVHPWHLETGESDVAKIGQAEAALLLIRFLNVLATAAGRTHPFVVLLVLSRLLEQNPVTPTRTPGRTPETRPAHTASPPGQLVAAEPRTARAPDSVRPSPPYTARTEPDCARRGGAL